MTLKEAVKNNFSRAARSYDAYSDVQDVCASALIEKMEELSFGNILDVGCGTGSYTAALRKKFPRASIKAVDISPDMVRIAREKFSGDPAEFVVADAETADLGGGFDLVTSNASFQWFDSPERALARFAGMTSFGGHIIFSTFGPATLSELNFSLKKMFGGGAETNSGNFIAGRRLKNILENNFRKVKVEERIYGQRYDSLLALFRKIKYSGARGYGVKENSFWTQGMMKELEKIYAAGFGGITATYQIFLCGGVK